MHDIRPERVIALERENTELRECIDKLFQQITELSAKYEAPVRRRTHAATSIVRRTQSRND